MKTVYNG